MGEKESGRKGEEETGRKSEAKTHPITKSPPRPLTKPPLTKLPPLEITEKREAELRNNFGANLKTYMMEKIISHKELKVYQLSFKTAMEIYHISKSFPKQEMYSLTDQIRRSSRSVSGNLAEAWRKRRYEKAFVAKLNDAEGEAAETQTWLDYALACEYIKKEEHKQINDKYEHILGMIVNMIVNKEKWIL